MAGPPRLLFESARYEPLPGDATTGVLAKIILGLADGKPAFDYASFQRFEKAVLLVRDPRDWLVSGLLFLPQQHPEIYGNSQRRSELMQLLQRKEREPDRVSFTELFQFIALSLKGQSPQGMLDWITAQLAWLIAFDQSMTGHHRLRYEDFVAGRLAPLEQYLGLPLTGTAEVDPIHGHVPRSRTSGDWKNWFIAGDEATFAPALAPFINHYGYASDWSVAQARHIPTALASGYVERTMARRLPEAEGSEP